MSAHTRSMAAKRRESRKRDEERRLLCEARVTLNGRPAKVSGYSLDFAVVSDLETGLGCEWAWATVKRIIERGGRFNV